MNAFSETLFGAAAAAVNPPTPYSLSMVNILHEDVVPIIENVNTNIDMDADTRAAEDIISTNISCTRGDPRESSRNWESFLLFIIIFNITAIVGNLIILITILASRAFRRPVNYLVANLSFASILCALSLSFRGLENTYGVWNYSPLLCFVLGTCHRLPHTVESFTVMYITLDRHRLCKFPLNRETKHAVLLKILIIWLVALALDIPRGLYHVYDPDVNTAYKCKKMFLFSNKYLHFTYWTIHAIFVQLCPIFILLREFINIRSHLVYLTVCKIQKSSHSICKRMQLLRGAWVLTGIFLLFNLPQALLNFLHEFCLQIWPSLAKVWWIYYFSRFCYYILATANSNAYPVFFLLTSSELRSKLKSYATTPASTMSHV